MVKSTTAGKSTASKTSSTSSRGKENKTLEDLLKTGLKDIYSAEQQMVKALPEMAKAAYSEDLHNEFNKHFQESKRHIERLEKVFSKLGINKNEVEKCEAMEGMVAEGKRVLEDFAEGHVRDSALIIQAQKVEHYEIASYGSLCELCDVLGYSQLTDLLGRTLDEEEKTDRTLTEIAQDVNDDALEISEKEISEFA
jgi:ferritin-like metal-binding protein YciE